MPRISAANVSTRAFPLPDGGAPNPGKVLAESAAYWWSARDVSTGSEETLPNRNGSGTAQLGSTAGSDTNDPLLLPHDGATDYMATYNTGSEYGNCAYQTGATSLTSSSTLEFIFRGAHTSGSLNYLMGGRSASHQLVVNADNTMMVKAYSGTVWIGDADSSVALSGGMLSGINWYRGILDAATAECTYYYSTDQVSDPDSVSWTELGTTQTGINAGSTPRDLLGGVSGATIGHASVGATANPLVKTVYGKWIYDSVTEHTFDATSTTGWTIGRSTTGLQTAFVLGGSRILFDGSDDYLVLPSAAATSYTATTGTLTVYVLMIAHTLVDNDRVFSGESTGNDGPSIRIRNTGTKFRMHSGGSVGTTSVDASITVGQLEGGALVVDTGTINGWSTTLGAMTGTGDMTADGTITHATSPRVGATAYAGGNAPELQVLEVLMFSSALTLADLTALDTYMQRIYE